MDCQQTTCPKLPAITYEITIDGELRIPDIKPPLESILDCIVEFEFSKVEVIDTKLTTGDPPQQLRKVIIMGEAIIYIKYVGDTEAGDQPVHAAHFKVPFQALVEWPAGPPAGTAVCVCATVEHFQIDPLNQRDLFKVLVVRLDVFRD